MDRGAWWATVHGVAESRTWLKWLSTHSFIDTGRRHKTPGPEAKDFITQWHRSRVSRFSCGSSLSPNSHRVIQRGLDGSCTCRVLHDRRDTLSLGNSNPLQWSMRKPALCSRGKCSVFQGWFLYRYPWKATSKPRKSVPLLMRCAEKWVQWRNCPGRTWSLCPLPLSIPFALLSLGYHLNWNVVVPSASSFCSQTGLRMMLGIVIFLGSEHLRFPRDLYNP